MKPEIRLEFCVTGNSIDSETISELMGISPSRTWKFDEPIKKTSLRRKHNGWCLSVELEEDVLDLSKSAEALLALLIPKAAILRKMRTEYNLNYEFSYAVYVIDETPIIDFAPDLLLEIGKLQAGIDIDIILTAEE